MSDDLDFSTLDAKGRGTVRLAEAALHAPPPPDQAEAKSRHFVEQLMQDAALSPRVLREAVQGQPRRPWWQKFLPKR